MSSDRGLEALTHLYHLEGSKDIVQRLGAILFPGRWPLLGNSYWNQAKRKGKITVVLTGPMGHNGPNSYLDAQQTLPNGVSFLEATVQHIRTIVLEGGVLGEGGGEKRALS